MQTGKRLNPRPATVADNVNVLCKQRIKRAYATVVILRYWQLIEQLSNTADRPPVQGPQTHAARHPLSRYLPARALAGSGMCHRHTLGCGSPGA